MSGIVLGNKNEQWCLDPKLKRLAKKIISENEAELGYIDLDKVVFSTLLGGAKLSWWGKCAKLSPQARLLTHYMLELFCDGDVDAINAFDQELLDVRYVITINEDAIYLASIDEVDKLREITLHHELKHIDPEMRKIVKHNIEDFSEILDRYGVHWTRGLIKEDDGIEESS